MHQPGSAVQAVRHVGKLQARSDAQAACFENGFLSRPNSIKRERAFSAWQLLQQRLLGWCEPGTCYLHHLAWPVGELDIHSHVPVARDGDQGYVGGMGQAKVDAPILAQRTE